MSTHKSQPVLELDGAHIGGTELANELEKATATTEANFEVHVVDPHPGRSAKVSAQLSRAGIPSTFEEGLARADSISDSRIVVIDSAQDTRRLVQDSESIADLQASFVFADAQLGPTGGNGWALSARLTPVRSLERDDAEEILTRFDYLSPTRETSKNVTGPILNWASTRRARQTTQALMARRAVDSLRGELVVPDLRIVDGSDGVGYQMIAVDTPARTRRHELKRQTVNEILPRFGEADRPRGVFFTRRSDPRMFLILAWFNEVRERWLIRKTVELPTPVPSELRFDFTPRPIPVAPGQNLDQRSQRRTQGRSQTKLEDRETDRPRLFVTD